MGTPRAVSYTHLDVYKRQGYTVGFFSLEMSGKEIAQRLICAYAMISISDFRMGRISPCLLYTSRCV